MLTFKKMAGAQCIQRREPVLEMGWGSGRLLNKEIAAAHGMLTAVWCARVTRSRSTIWV